MRENRKLRANRKLRTVTNRKLRKNRKLRANRKMRIAAQSQKIFGRIRNRSAIANDFEACNRSANTINFYRKFTSLDPFVTEKGEKMLHEFCEEKKGVVVKEFRLDKPEQLYTLVDDTGVDLKIIRLIRDPRSMLVSRNGLTKGLKPCG